MNAHLFFASITTALRTHCYETGEHGGMEHLYDQWKRYGDTIWG